MKGMESLQDLIEEAKLRTVWWALCIFAVSYFLTHTSKSMWMNIPISVLMVSGLRVILNEVDFHWKVRNIKRKTYLSHLENKQLSVNDSRLCAVPPPPKRKRKIDSPIIEAAMEEFIEKLLQDFVVDLWYSEITPDKEAPELIRAVIMDVLADVSGRVKDINLVELLTRDVVDLIGAHIDIFRRSQTAIGIAVMQTLSSEERDKKLKHQLSASKELHPALKSSDCEYKVLQRLMSGVLAVALRPREAQSPLVRCIARELLTCLVMQPLINLASPEYINELIEHIYLAIEKYGFEQAGDDRSPVVDGHMRDHVLADFQHHSSDPTSINACNRGTDLTSSNCNKARELSPVGSGTSQDEYLQHLSAEWARPLEAASQRRAEVLMPENLENMWTKGRNHRKEVKKYTSTGVQAQGAKGLEVNSVSLSKDTETGSIAQKPEISTKNKAKASAQTPPSYPADLRRFSQRENTEHLYGEPSRVPSFKAGRNSDESTDALVSSGNRSMMKKSNSTSDLVILSDRSTALTSKIGGPIISEFYSPNSDGHNQVATVNSSSRMVLSSEAHTPKLKSRVIGAYFEKLGSKSFAVYSIAVTDTENNTWFVKRRYRNFERLHRHLKDIPNYTLNLPPKRIFSSSTEDTFVHQRCIQLDKYLQDLLSIANVAEQHEVWDFLSVSSKNYSFGKSPSVMRTLAVNVDDAVDDIVRQFKGVSDGLMRKVSGSSSAAYEQSSLNYGQHTVDSANSYSDDGEGEKGASHSGERSFTETDQCNSDNELNSEEFLVTYDKKLRLDADKHTSKVQSESTSISGFPRANIPVTSSLLEDLNGVPQEWVPPNLSVPVLNLVDNIFQLKRRGWLRRQVFWISKQVLQLVMEDAIDDWMIRQIHWIRREDIIAQGIRWVQDVLWPDGVFFLPLNTKSKKDDFEGGLQSTTHSARSAGSKPGYFEEQRASDVREILFNGAPAALVGLIGHNQYKQCAQDIYFFLQSRICLKQLTYGILELVLVSIFPELQEIVLDMHEKIHDESV
ncbi:Phox-associated domain Phox-like Sorting nexin C-terminal [Heracleum sosnowskyi]|uniref:Phox-associated domain Phox-like Sorting nexin C-terminal n=1 Tax=Heracleum sosnowskyi TaxID=360622 RepID=A0AAD8IZU5_9APIA|nr:Phox-associated domain Phox-like Sorting nexin C-terminal [Heracleum sosnowskyi]